MWAVLSSRLGGYCMAGGCVGVWAVLTSRLGGRVYRCLGMRCVRGTHLRVGQTLRGWEGAWVFGWHLGVGWVGSTHLRAGQTLRGREGASVGGTYLRAGWALRGPYFPPGWAGVAWAVLTSKLGGLWVGGTYLRPGWEGVWAVLTSDLGGRVFGGTHLRAGRALRGRYLPPGWAVSGWAGLHLAASTCAP